MDPPTKGNKRSLSAKRNKHEQPKKLQRPFYCAQAVSVLWCDKYYEADIVQDHGDGTYSVLYVNFETENYEEHVRRNRVRNKNLAPTAEELSTSLVGRKVRVLWANELRYYEGMIYGWATKEDGKGSKRSKDGTRKHLIRYDDGDVMAHDLSQETVQLEPGEGGEDKLVPMHSGDDAEDEVDAKRKKSKIPKNGKVRKSGKKTSSSIRAAATSNANDFSRGDIVQCRAPNSRWYRAIVVAVHVGAYDILYERSNATELKVPADRVQTYVKARDRLRDGTPRVGAPKPRGKKRKGQTSSADDTSGDSALSSISESESESESSSESESEEESEEEEDLKEDISRGENKKRTTNTSKKKGASKAASKTSRKGAKGVKTTKKNDKSTVSGKTAKKKAKPAVATAKERAKKKKTSSRGSRAERAAMKVLSLAAQKVRQPHPQYACAHGIYLCAHSQLPFFYHPFFYLPCFYRSFRRASPNSVSLSASSS